MATEGLTYDVGEVTRKEAEAVVQKLEAEGIISKMQVGDKGYFSPVMFLGNNGGQNVRKVVDSRLLNA